MRAGACPAEVFIKAREKFWSIYKKHASDYPLLGKSTSYMFVQSFHVRTCSAQINMDRKLKKISFLCTVKSENPLQVA